MAFVVCNHFAHVWDIIFVVLLRIFAWVLLEYLDDFAATDEMSDMAD